MSIVTLTVTATNATTSPVAMPQLGFSIPQGDASVSTVLTTSANVGLVTATAGPGTPWAIVASDTGAFTAMPLPPCVSVNPGQQLSFVFSNIVVNQTGGSATIAVTENGVAVTGPAVDKSTLVAAGGSTPVVSSFTASPSQVARGGNTTLAWQTTNLTSAVLQPPGTPLNSATLAAGSVVVPVYRTTTFTLSGAGPGGVVASTPVVVTVMPVAIESLTATPATIASGDAALLSWSTQFAQKVSLDQGIGHVNGAGQQQVSPTQTTTYTLTAEGLESSTKAITITVT